jgi:YfiH family protein
VSNVLSLDWPAPEAVGAAITVRTGGVSEGPFEANNMALHVDDNEFAVHKNRQVLQAELSLEQQPLWLDQCHGTDIVLVEESLGVPRADASQTRQANRACVVMTADCLPVLFCNHQGTQVAAVHAGWRGLCNGILRKTVAQFDRPESVIAYLGPAIGPKVYEVGAELLPAFVKNSQDAVQVAAIQAAFVPLQSGKFLANLYALARAELASCGVNAVYGGEFCTFSEPERFYSYRRAPKTGRTASLIWLKNGHGISL